MFVSYLETVNTESQDRILAGSNTSNQSKLLFAEFGNHLSTESRLQIRQIRIKVILHRVCRRQPIPERLARLFVQILTGKNKQSIELANNLSCDRKALSLLRSNYDPESDSAELLTSLITIIDTPTALPPLVSPQQIVPIVVTSRGANPDVDEATEDDATLNNNSDIGVIELCFGLWLLREAKKYRSRRNI